MSARQHRLRRALALVGAGILARILVACTGGEAATRDSGTAVARVVEDTSYKLAPGYVVDSLRPNDEELRRFRADLGAPVTRLEHGAPSIDALVRRFTRAVETSDTSTLRALHVTRAEFAWLLYPESPSTHPPYRQPPDVAWMLQREGSVKGLTRLVRRRGGQPLRVTGWRCEPKPAREGRNLIWRQCVLHTTATAGAPASERLFGAVVARDGVFKIASYANQY